MDYDFSEQRSSNGCLKEFLARPGILASFGSYFVTKIDCLRIVSVLCNCTVMFDQELVL